MISIVVNGEAAEVSAGETLAGLLARFELVPQRVAVEVNERLVRRDLYSQTALTQGDRVEIVTLVGGG